MGELKTKIIKLINGFHIGSIYFAMVLLIGMTLVIVVNVFMRYVMNSGIRWAEEVAKLLMVWFTFLGMAIGVKQGLHISLHLLPKNLPSLLEKALIFLKDITTLAIAAVFLVYGIKIVEFTSKSIMPATEWPSSVLYLILPISACLIISEALVDIFKMDDEADNINKLFNKGDAS